MKTMKVFAVSKTLIYSFRLVSQLSSLMIEVKLGCEIYSLFIEVTMFYKHYIRWLFSYSCLWRKWHSVTFVGL